MATIHDDCLVRPCDVKEIVDTDLTDPRIANFCNMAYLATLPLVGNLGECGGTDALKQIQLLLAAHFLKLAEPVVSNESIAGEYSVSYAIKTGANYDATPYGQQARVLDCSGLLARAGRKRASFRVTSYYQLADSGHLFDSDLR